jgi:hypothetical protein
MTRMERKPTGATEAAMEAERRGWEEQIQERRAATRAPFGSELPNLRYSIDLYFWHLMRDLRERCDGEPFAGGSCVFCGWTTKGEHAHACPWPQVKRYAEEPAPKLPGT